MKIGTWLGTGMVAVLLAGCGGGDDDAAKGDSKTARAALTGADNAQYGEAVVTEGDGGLTLKLTAQNLKPGAHGVHIHQTGKCEGPDYKSAGGHWNPEDKQHGFDNPQGAHKGDFFNLDIGQDGKGSLEASIEGAALRGEGNGLLDADGAAFVIHAGPDDLKTDPSGDSGDRVACGVFE